MQYSSSNNESNAFSFILYVVNGLLILGEFLNEFFSGWRNLWDKF